MRHRFAWLFTMLVCLLACGPGGPGETSGTGGVGGTGGSGGGAGTSVSSSTGGTGGMDAGPPPKPWTVGLPGCNIIEPIPGEAGGPTVIWQRFQPPGLTVTRIGTTVARDDGTGPVGALAGPYDVLWAVSDADGVLQVAPRVSGVKTIDESAVAWLAAPNDNIGFTDFDLDMPFDLLPGEILWVGGGLDDHGGIMPPNSVCVCANDSSLAADMSASTGTCPGASCVTGAMPAMYANMSGLAIAKGH